MCTFSPETIVLHIDFYGGGFKEPSHTNTNKNCIFFKRELKQELYEYILVGKSQASACINAYKQSL